MDNTPSSTNRPEVVAIDLSKVNDQTIIRCGLIMAIGLLIASTSPPGLAMPMFSGILFINFILSAAIALFVREKMLSPHLTRWDEAAAYFVTSWVVCWLVDPAALSAAMLNAGIMP